MIKNGEVFPTQDQMAEDTVAAAMYALTIGNPPFDQILWDAHRHVLSFRRTGGDYINLWMHRHPDGTGRHYSERNSTPSADSEVLWADGNWVDGRFDPTVPPDLRADGN